MLNKLFREIQGSLGPGLDNIFDGTRKAAVHEDMRLLERARQELAENGFKVGNIRYDSGSKFHFFDLRGLKDDTKLQEFIKRYNGDVIAEGAPNIGWVVWTEVGTPNIGSKMSKAFWATLNNRAPQLEKEGLIRRRFSKASANTFAVRVTKSDGTIELRHPVTKEASEKSGAGLKYFKAAEDDALREWRETGNRWSTIEKRIRDTYSLLTDEEIADIKGTIMYELEQQKIRIESDKKASPEAVERVLANLEGIYDSSKGDMMVFTQRIASMCPFEFTNTDVAIMDSLPREEVLSYVTNILRP